MFVGSYISLRLLLYSGLCLSVSATSEWILDFNET